MERHNARLDYPKNEFRIILQSSRNSNEFYGLNDLQRKTLKIILARYGCRHTFHVLPDHAALDMHRFLWNEMSETFEIEKDMTVSVNLNTLEETIVDYIPNEEFYEYRK